MLCFYGFWLFFWGHDIRGGQQGTFEETDRMGKISRLGEYTAKSDKMYILIIKEELACFERNKLA